MRSSYSPKCVRAHEYAPNMVTASCTPMVWGTCALPFGLRRPPPHPRPFNHLGRSRWPLLAPRLFPFLPSFSLFFSACDYLLFSQPASQLHASNLVRPSVGLSRLRSPVRQSVCQRTHRALSPSRPLGVAGGLAKRESWPTREETDLELELELGARRSDSSERGRRWAEGNKAAEGAGTEGGWRGPQ